jgi:hypothetical protein
MTDKYVMDVNRGSAFPIKDGDYDKLGTPTLSGTINAVSWIRKPDDSEYNPNVLLLKTETKAGRAFKVYQEVGIMFENTKPDAKSDYSGSYGHQRLQGFKNTSAAGNSYMSLWIPPEDGAPPVASNAVAPAPAIAEEPIDDIPF